MDKIAEDVKEEEIFKRNLNFSFDTPCAPNGPRKEYYYLDARGRRCSASAGSRSARLHCKRKKRDQGGARSQISPRSGELAVRRVAARFSNLQQCLGWQECDGVPKELEPATLSPSHFTHIIPSNSLDEAELQECHSHAYTHTKAECA